MRSSEGVPGVLRAGRLRARRSRKGLLALALLVALAGALSTFSHSRVPNHVNRTASTGLWKLPLAAQGPISELLGRASSGYAVRGLSAVNPAQRLHLAFSSSGVRVSSGSAGFGIALSAYGHGDSLARAAPVAPRVKANRVTYARHAGLTEWFTNGPVGLEQGFTLASRPSLGIGPLELALSLTGGLTARSERGGVLLEGKGTKLRYGGLFATDARGHTLRSWLALAGGRIVIRVDDRGAAYPVRIDPFVQQAVLTTAVKPTGGLSFGYATAISDKTIVVGEPQAEEGRGAAYVFQEPPSGWANAHETLKLTASDRAEHADFGESVAISGNTIAVGSPSEKPAYSYYYKGAAYIFQTSSSWMSASQVALLTVPDPTEPPGPEEVSENEALGSSVALSGSTLVAGAPGRLRGQGIAYVFEKPAGGWSNSSTPSAVLHEPAVIKKACPEFGSAVALAGDTAVVGARGNYSPESSFCETQLSGRAYVFVKPPGGWAGELESTVTLIPSGSAANDQFGSSVAITEVADVIAVGSPERAGAHPRQGAAYLFERPSGGWIGSPTQQPFANPAGAEYEEFGRNVALTPDGTSLVVAAPGIREGKSQSSAVFVYGIPAGGWTGTIAQPQQLGGSGGIGYSVAASNNTIVAPSAVAAYVFGRGLGAVISSPANSATYTQGQEVKAAYACSAPPGEAVTHCTGTVANGAAIDTSSVGVHNFSVEAEDSAGEKASSISVYQVVSPGTTPAPEATSKTAPTPTKVVLTPAEQAAAEAAQKARQEKYDEEFARFVEALAKLPSNTKFSQEFLNEGGYPVSYKLVPDPGRIDTSASTSSAAKATSAGARASAARAKKPTTVFKLSYQITKAGPVSFKIPLTGAGRKLLKQDLKAHRSQTIYWTVTYIPQGRPTVTLKFKVTLKPEQSKKKTKKKKKKKHH